MNVGCMREIPRYSFGLSFCKTGFVFNRDRKTLGEMSWRGEIKWLVRLTKLTWLMVEMLNKCLDIRLWNLTEAEGCGI